QGRKHNFPTYLLWPLAGASPDVTVTSIAEAAAFLLSPGANRLSFA
ncbi:MAG: hypothetical protein JWM55_1809, partial [Acidimicrobiaceae bacterium]|nr:hypothetical protein [Acidimicrobiaceae bacterium]